jgi:isochorismate synthase
VPQLIRIKLSRNESRVAQFGRHAGSGSGERSKVRRVEGTRRRSTGVTPQVAAAGSAAVILLDLAPLDFMRKTASSSHRSGIPITLWRLRISIQDAAIDQIQLFRSAISCARLEERRILVSWNVGQVAVEFDHIRRSVGRMETRTFYWASPKAAREMIAIGVASDLGTPLDDRWATMGAAWANLCRDGILTGGAPNETGPLLIGGGSYYEESSAYMPNAAFWVPELQFIMDDDKSVNLTVNIICDARDDEVRLARRLDDTIQRAMSWRTPARCYAARLTRFEQIPPFNVWSRQVAQILSGINDGLFQKVVLARTFEIGVEGSLDVPLALERLARKQSQAIIFAICLDKSAFLGATPELLARVDGTTVRTIALAGSARRGRNPTEDAQIGRWLQANPKEKHEHSLVAQYIIRTLSRICLDVSADAAPRLVKYPNIQHLATNIVGRLSTASPAKAFNIVAALHPTPAVGGMPHDAALDWQRTHEGIDRGWYAGPIGWVDTNGNAEFAVAIRSAFVGQKTAVVYAGCGIVKGSDPSAEYAETQIKAEPMLSALLPGAETSYLDAGGRRRSMR